MSDQKQTRGPGRRRKTPGQATASKRQVDYHHLRNPFPPIDVFSTDQIEAINEAALKTLEHLGMKVLLLMCCKCCLLRLNRRMSRPIYAIFLLLKRN